MGFPGRAPTRTSAPASRASMASRAMSGFGVTRSGSIRRTHRKSHKKTHHGSTAGMRMAREQMRKNEALMQQMIIMMAATAGRR